MLISDRVKSIELSQTAEIFDKVNMLRDSGKEVISFSVGDIGFPPSDIATRAVESALINRESNHYSNTTGLLNLKKEIIKRIYFDDKYEYDIDSVIICNGAKQCLYNILMTVVDTGDEVIIPLPYWTTYPAIVKLAGGIPVFIKTISSDGYSINLPVLESKITRKTKAIIINNPNNPTGCIYSSIVLHQILSLAIKYNFMVICDEVYRNYIFQDSFVSMNSMVNAETIDRIAVINSLSKSHALAGWRIGYMTVPKLITKYAYSLQSQSTSNTNTLMQLAAINIINHDDAYTQFLRVNMEKNKKLMLQYLKEIYLLDIDFEPKAAFYIFAKINLSSISAITLSTYILENAMVSIMPGSAFGADDYVRLSFSMPEKDIKTGMERITSLFQKSIFL